MEDYEWPKRKCKWTTITRGLRRKLWKEVFVQVVKGRRRNPTGSSVDWGAENNEEVYKAGRRHYNYGLLSRVIVNTDCLW
jgi:hypothetical protein